MKFTDSLIYYEILGLLIAFSIAEFLTGAFKSGKWNKNEWHITIAGLALSSVITRPLSFLFTAYVLNYFFPDYYNYFSGISLWAGVLITCILEDFTQYWWHRAAHTYEWLWKGHRVHHSAPEMSVFLSGRNSWVYLLLFPSRIVSATLVFLGFGEAFIIGYFLKILIGISAHSSIRWDKPLYAIKWLHPIMWVVERVISTPATHHAHHAASDKDGIGVINGNYGNMFFIWDIIFGTGKITRQYPETIGLEEYYEEPWYVQLGYPIFKSKDKRSEMSK
ncbi:sterol desaturase family protein [Runella sp. MFBS21]|uniref:sterol desaturase family protein n=1 Tax=Runella sp. MFBS21 TaxID=3034018 RepID=UPI0023FA2DAC|nr:sterol desaturase family protein [Runella sp. MFBS21]MDF7816793.1 sterol desaturase family protein [Runella sp. MFBS21]